MSIIFADFPSGQHGIYGSSASNMLNGIWAGLEQSFSIANDPDPNIGSLGKVLALNTDTSVIPTQASIAMPTVEDVIGVGTRLWLERLPFGSNTSGKPFIQYRTGSDAAICSIMVNPNGAIEVRTGTQAGTVVGTSGPVITANAWQHVEVKVLRDAAAGTIEVRVEGVVALALTGLALGAVDIGIIALEMGQIVSAVDYTAYWKDIVFWDANGSVGNDFQGSVSVRDLYTDADIDLNWTPSTGSTGWDLLDKTSPDDTTYIQASDPPPDAAVFSLTDLPIDVTSVRALLPIYRSVKTDGGDCNLQVGLTPNNVDWDDGADTPITTAYTFRWDVSELSPDTAAPWTITEVNSAYVRIDRTL